MKYCSKCGNPVEDDMRFCQKCGAKVTDPASSDSAPNITQEKSEKTEQTPPPAPEFPVYPHIKNRKPIRIGMSIWAGFFGLFAVIYLIIALCDDPNTFSLSFFLFSITFIFIVLSRSPKGSPYLLGKEQGIPKYKFVFLTFGIGLIISIFLSFVLPSSSLTDSKSGTAEDAVASSEPAKTPEEISSMEEVETWYQAQIPFVEQSVKEYAETKSGVTDIKMTNTKFYFGESDGWTDCYYKTTFTCKLNGEDCNGETRGFLKVGESDIYLFDYELWRESDYFTITEENDTSIDQTMEDYYHQLKKDYQ